MRPNRHPADALAEIRAEIRMLKQKEATLRTALINNAVPRVGEAVRVEIKYQKQRRFCKERLPHEILHDPRLWEEKSQKVVKVVPLAEKAENGARDFEMLQRYRAATRTKLPA